MRIRIVISGFVAVLFAAGSAQCADVKLTDGARDYTLDNGIVAARVEKGSGNLDSLKYEGRELLGSARRAVTGRTRRRTAVASPIP